jgi:hypothetical protein
MNQLRYGKTRHRLTLKFPEVDVTPKCGWKDSMKINVKYGEF